MAELGAVETAAVVGTEATSAAEPPKKRAVRRNGMETSRGKGAWWRREPRAKRWPKMKGEAARAAAATPPAVPFQKPKASVMTRFMRRLMAGYTSGPVTPRSPLRRQRSGHMLRAKARR